MAKRDINYLKHIKPQIKERERQDKSYSHQLKSNRVMADLEQKWADEEHHRKETCKLAANMDCRERLLNYFSTFDSTYLGTGCDWDLLTRLGMRKKRLI